MKYNLIRNTNRQLTHIALLLLMALAGCAPGESHLTIRSWITTWDGPDQLTSQPVVETTTGDIGDSIIIHINPEAHHQPMLGFGGTFTDADIYDFMRMSKAKRTEALRALFDPEEGVGWNLMRLSFGSTDWDRDFNFYTYDDMPRGQQDDALLSHFSVEEDVRREHFTLFREVLDINPKVKFIASVWEPPAWMKDNDKLISDGTVLPYQYGAFALYLVKTIKAYEQQGIPILSLTPQNEPLCTDGRLTPQALYLDWKPMRDMVKVIRQAFDQNDIDTELWIFDHNFIFAESWVAPFLKDTATRGTFDGVAWHDYEGAISSLCTLSSKYPEIPMYHTERALYTPDGLARLLQIIRCGARSHNHWVTISDEYGAPHQFKGGNKDTDPLLDEIYLSALYNHRDHADDWVKTKGYYTFAQLSKFVKRGAVQIESQDTGETLANAAFVNPDGSLVLVVSNAGKSEKAFVVSVAGNQAPFRIPAKSAATYVIENFTTGKNK